MKKDSELRELNAEELREKLSQAREELFNLRFQHATGQLDNPMKLRETRKRIARIETIRRELASQTGEAREAGGVSA